MIIHKLIAHHLAHGDDPEFYRIQAEDAVRWIEQAGVAITPGMHALDLGAGHGIFGSELLKRGCQVTFADEQNSLLPDLRGQPFVQVNLDREDVARLGTFDLVICSNVLEHLARPYPFIASIVKLLKPGGAFYLSWTNWLSPWGGHEFSPFHYLGPRLGPRLYDKLTGKQRSHTPFVNLFPTAISSVLRVVRQQPRLRLLRLAPRYYPEFSFILRVPLLREFLTWNCSLLIKRHDEAPKFEMPAEDQ